jgi:hypothetical protein
VVKDIEIGNDIDLFIVGTEERAQMIMEFEWTFYRIIHRSVRKCGDVFVRTLSTEIFRFRSS